MPAILLPLLLIAHVILAITLFLPSLLLPFALRTRRAPADSESSVVHALLGMQSSGTLLVGIGLAITGVALIAVLGSSIPREALAARGARDLRGEPPGRVLRPAAEPSPVARDQWRLGRPGLGGAGPAAAIRFVRDGGDGRDDRLPHEHEAGAVVIGG